MGLVAKLVHDGTIERYGTLAYYIEELESGRYGLIARDGFKSKRTFANAYELCAFATANYLLYKSI